MPQSKDLEKVDKQPNGAENNKDRPIEALKNGEQPRYIGG